MRWENSKPKNGIYVRYLEEDQQKGDRWMVTQPIVYQTPIGEVIIPPGYITDFASTPVLLWGLFPPIGRHNRAAILHDYWYDERLGENRLGRIHARQLADREFLRLLNQAEPHRKLRNRLMYWACRWFGRSWWVN